VLLQKEYYKHTQREKMTLFFGNKTRLPTEN